MKTLKKIQIFKPGAHTTSAGAVLEFSESDLLSVVAAYDPALSEAPLVIGHPKDNGPAWGWVKSVSFADGALCADADDVDDVFSAMLTTKKFKKRSASFWLPDAPGNPKPGSLYLRHVGFLGAMPPSVKGLQDIAFAGGDDGVVEFSDYEDRIIARVLRGLRNFFISEYGLEKADAALSEWDVSELADMVAQPEAGEPEAMINFNDGDDMTEADKARLQALEAENARLKESASLLVLKAAHEQHVSFAEALRDKGQLLPIHVATVVATLDFIGTQEQVVEFSESDGRSVPLVDGVKAVLSAMPVQVTYGEFAGSAGAGSGVVSFSAPVGHVADGGRMELHSRVVAYKNAHGVTYLQALAVVGGNS